MFEDMKEDQQKAKSDGDVTDCDLHIGSFRHSGQHICNGQTAIL